MPQTNQIILNWTPSPDAVSQKVMRATSSSGPYTLLTTLGGTTSTYTDTTVDPYPHTTYYYRIDTVCSNNNTTPSAVVDEVSKDCDTSNAGVIFGAKALTFDFGYGSEVTYTDKLRKYLDNTSPYNASPYPPVPTTDSSILTTGATSLFCPACGDEIVESAIDFEGTLGTGTSDWSNFSTHDHVASYLPTPPTNLGGSANDNLGTIIRKHNAVGNIQVSRGRFSLGIGGTGSTDPFVPWYGGEVGVVNNSMTNISYPYGSPPSILWNYDAVPYPSSYNLAPRSFTQLVISKQQPNSSDLWVPSNLTVGTLGATMTGLASVGVSGTWYCSIIDTFNVYYDWLKCEHHMYQMYRRSDWDQYDINNNLLGYGYQIVGALTHYVPSTNLTIYGSPARHIYKPNSYNQQPSTIIKIWQA